MGCEVVNIGGGLRAIVCGRKRSPRCKVCGAASERQCDWKMPQKRSGTCDVHLCASCSVSPAKDKDLCPTHAKAWEAFKQSRGIGNDKGESETQ